jgi:hypothetical protein
MAELASGRQVTDVWDLRRADGGYMPFELSHAFTPDGLWQINGRDITVRQQDEAERDRVEAEREEQHQSEHEISELLQRSLLPVLAELDGQDLAVRYEPAVHALEVGGDWYDAIAWTTGGWPSRWATWSARGRPRPRRWGSCAARPGPCCWRDTGRPRC